MAKYKQFLRDSYGIGQPFVNVFPSPVIAQRAPTAGDIDQPIGRTWINILSGQAWILTNVAAGVATWALASPGASDVDTLTGDAGGPISPVLGDIILAGGTNIGSTGAGNTITFNLDPAIVLATSVTAPLYTAAAADVLIQTGGVNDVVVRLGDAAGATFFRVQDSTNADVWTVDSNGVFAAFAGLTVTGIFTQTGGAVNIGMDNLGSAINIGGGNVIKAIAIGGGAAAHTLALGSAAAGAVTIDTAAGISLDAATASNFTVTGAGLDLSLQGVGGAVNITSTQNENDAIMINASDAAGGVQIHAGTGGILIGDDADTTGLTFGNIAPTATRNISIGTGTVVTAAVTDTINLGTGGATTNANSIKTVNINTGGVAVGQVLTNIASGAVTSGTHTTSIATGNRAAGTMVLNTMTGSGTKTLNIGNADGLTTVNIDAITLINDSINVATSINTGTSTGAVAIGNALAGAITVDTAAGISLDSATASNFTVTGAANLTLASSAGNVIVTSGVDATIDTVGVLELNSSGAAISIGTDANNFGVNIGTNGIRTVNIGSTTGASALILRSGTGDITVTGTVKEIGAEFLSASGDYVTFQSNPVVQSAANTGAAPTGVTGDVNIISCQEGVVLEEFVLGAGQTILAPRMGTTGLIISGDLTATEGYEYNYGAARLNSRHAFTVGTSPAFFLEVSMTVADVTGGEPYMIGFRKVEANNATLTSYTDYAMIGLDNVVSPGNITLKTELNSGGTTSTNTTDAWADTATKILRINVSAAGVVTYTINGAAPTVTAAFTFDAADVICPFIRIMHGAAAPGTVTLQSLKVGYQP